MYLLTNMKIGCKIEMYGEDQCFTRLTLGEFIGCSLKKFHGKMKEAIPGFQSSGLNKHKDVSNVAYDRLCEPPSHMG